MNKCPPLAFEVIAKFFNPSSEGSSCDGRVVKALDLKSNTVSVRRFESCSQRMISYFFFFFYDSKIFTHIYKDNLRDLTAATIFSACF